MGVNESIVTKKIEEDLDVDICDMFSEEELANGELLSCWIDYVDEESPYFIRKEELKEVFETGFEDLRKIHGTIFKDKRMYVLPIKDDLFLLIGFISTKAGTKNPFEKYAENRCVVYTEDSFKEE